MKLFYSPNSPYARIARVAVIESGLADHVDHIRVRNRAPDSPLLQYSPVCRVPTLVDGELVLGEARTICAYLEGVSDRRVRLVSPSRDDWPAQSCESMIVGFLDGIAVWIREGRRADHERSAILIETERTRCLRCLNYFERTMTRPPAAIRSWCFAAIALACALQLMEARRLVPDWRATRPKLSAWLDGCLRRTSMQDTAPLPAG